MLQESCSGDIIDSNFTSNIASQAGGAHWVDVAPTLTIYGNTYTYNNATTGSAGIFAQAVVNSTFANLHFGDNVGEKGAALFQGNCNSTTISNSTFYNNSATTFGGAVFRSLTTGSLTTSYFSTNYAGRFGGAIYDVNVTGKHMPCLRWFWMVLLCYMHRGYMHRGSSCMPVSHVNLSGTHTLTYHQ